MRKLKVNELMKNLELGEFGDNFCDYDKGYVCDIITEIADNNIDIYTIDLIDWAKDNVANINDAMIEFGTPNNFLQIIQQGQYYANERKLYNNLQDSLKNFAYNYILNVLKIDEITEEQNKELLKYDFDDSNIELEDIVNYVKNIFEKGE